MKLPAYPRTKPSGVEWLGDVPEHWSVCAVWHLFSLGRGRVISHEDIREDPGDYPVYSSQTENDGVLGCLGTFDFEGDYVTWTTDGANAGTVFRRTGKFNCTNVCGTLKATNAEKVDTRFAAHALNLATGEFVRHDINPKLMNNVMAKIRFGVPSIAEQRAIAACLDRETRRLDRLVGRKRELIERLKEKRTALISRTVTRGLPPAAARAAGLPENPPLKPSGLDWLGDIPKHWEVKKLSWLFRYSKGPSAAMLTKEYVADNSGDYPVFSGQTENEGLMGMIDWHEFNVASPVIFVTTVGARAMSTRIVSGRFSLSQNCALIIPRSANADPRYYEAVLRGLFDYERRSISLIMQPSLRFDDLDKFRVPLPPPEEQTAIAEYLGLETAKLDALVGNVEAAAERLQEYRTALITAAVTGKFDVRKESRA